MKKRIYVYIYIYILLLTDVPHNTCTQQIHFENFNEELFL